LIESEKTSASLKSWKDIPSLKLLNLVYDLTPTEFITMVITEVGMVPPTSVPAIMRGTSLSLMRSHGECRIQTGSVDND
jgi:translation initiation factor 2B subunit (eIF-2B alpha/beta/delta family)